MFGNHVMTKKKGWHRCGTCQMDSDYKVSNDTIKVENEIGVNAMSFNG